ncbi:ankyrin repeat-containing protein kinase A-like [Sipha flava]|uniref:Ankyrin repeat-containing protein kinase A-like n=1 Tax=Sipha flava TaxID=143950 RepID=A0A2S2QAU6_9HEMI|nr:ankyrin repeat-containing protein kinase A-like [Sipha flava]XP_025420782.1 ankyrin repeat-containing protein kinase A-like [Sipha flava]
MDKRPYLSQNNWNQHYATYFVSQGNPSEQRAWMQNTNVRTGSGGSLPSRVNESIGFDGFPPIPVIGSYGNPPSQSTAFSRPTEHVSYAGTSNDSASSFSTDYSVFVSAAEVEKVFGDMIYNGKNNPERLSRNTRDYPQQNYIHANTSIYSGNNNNGSSSSNNYVNNGGNSSIGNSNYVKQHTMWSNSVYLPENRSSYRNVEDPGSQHSPQMQFALQQPQNVVYGGERTTWRMNPPSVQEEYGNRRAPVTGFGSVRLQSTAVTTAFPGPTEPLYLESSTEVANDLFFDDRQGHMPSFLAEQLIDMMNEQTSSFSEQPDDVMSAQTNGYCSPESPSKSHYGPPPNNMNSDGNGYSADGAQPARNQNHYGDSNGTGRDRSPHHRTVVRDFDRSSQQSLRFESGARMSTAPMDNKYSSVVGVNTIVNAGSSSGPYNSYDTDYPVVGVSPSEADKTASPTGTESASCPPVDSGPIENLDFTERPKSEAVVNGNPRIADSNANASLPARCHGPESNETSASPVVTAATSVPSVNISKIETVEKVPTLKSDCDNSGSKKVIANETTDHNQPKEQLHRGVKRHRCQDCGKCFNYPHEWKLHKKTHMNVKLYTCHKCRESFPLLFLFESHNFRKHSK